MADRSKDGVILAQVMLNGVRLGRRLHDKQSFGHNPLIARIPIYGQAPPALHRSKFDPYRMMVGAHAVPQHLRMFDGQRLGNEDVVQLRAGEGVSDLSGKSVDQFVFDEALFNADALAPMEQRIAYAAAEDPVERGDMPRLKRVEIAAHDRRPGRIAFCHRRFEFFQPPRGMGQDEVEIEDAQRDCVRCYIGVQAAAVADLAERRYEAHEKARIERQERPVLVMRYFTLRSDGMPRQYDVEIADDIPLEKPLDVGAVRDGIGKGLQPFKKIFRHLL